MSHLGSIFPRTYTFWSRFLCGYFPGYENIIGSMSRAIFFFYTSYVRILQFLLPPFSFYRTLHSVTPNPLVSLEHFIGRTLVKKKWQQMSANKILVTVAIWCGELKHIFIIWCSRKCPDSVTHHFIKTYTLMFAAVTGKNE